MSTPTKETIVYEDDVMRLIKKTSATIDKTCLEGYHWDDIQMKCVRNPEPPPSGSNIDSDGIPIMSMPKVNGRNWYLKPEALGTLSPIDSNNRIFPSADPILAIEAQTASIQTLPNTTKKYLHTTGTKSEQRCSLHMASHKQGDDDEKAILYCWNTGAAQKHYMKYPDDIMSGEYTMIFKITGIIDIDNEVSFILAGGGHHQIGSPYNNQASCFNTHFKYKGSNSKNTNSVEFDHGFYERVSQPIQTTYDTMESRPFGVKVCSMPKPDFSARDVITFINDDPIDLTTGKPKTTGWRKYTTWTQTDYKGAKNPHCWGGVNDKSRCDKIKEMDFYYMSRIEISAMPSSS